MKTRYYILSLCIIVLANVLVQWCFFRIDLSQDKRYSLSPATKQMLQATADPVEVTLYLDGELNSGFLRLQSAVKDILHEMQVYADIHYTIVAPNSLAQTEQNTLQDRLDKHGLHPVAIYERDGDGKSSQTIVYPFALVQYGGKEEWVALLQNNRGMSGAENLNASIENLEYAFAQTLHSLQASERQKVVFLEGQGEAPEQNTADAEQVLSQWFDVYRGAITADAACLDPFKVVVVADPQLPFSEKDKYVLDQYLMRGGRILWLVNGVRFSEQVLTDEGFTPVMPLDINLTDMLFRYGVRINPHLVQDKQCLSVPVDVSPHPDQPQWQPVPWYYAPLLLTSQQSAITKGVMQVSATFSSDLDLVGQNENINSEILLATSDASSMIGAPSEVNLDIYSQDSRPFNMQYIPVAASLEGQFSSLFAHRMRPEGVEDNRPIQALSNITKQIVVATGSVICNDLQQGQPLPMGYDRYSRMQFGNRDFIVNSMLYLADDAGLIQLREKTIPLRLLNKEKTKKYKTSYQVISTITPLLILLLTAALVEYARRRRYTKYVSYEKGIQEN